MVDVVREALAGRFPVFVEGGDFLDSMQAVKRRRVSERPVQHSKAYYP